MKSLLIPVSLLLVTGAVPTPLPQPYPYALAHHEVSTKNAVAKLCFDRGLTLYYSFNRLASQRAFECAARADPTFAMAYWGIALAHGSNINVTVDAAGEKAAHAAIHRAIALQSHASSAERDYIAALSTRYSNRDKPNLDALAVAYSDAMKNLAARYPDDMDALSLYAESEMDLQPWEWYTPRGAPIARTIAIRATIDSILVRDPQNIAANHLNIHMTEESLHPQDGLANADRLRSMKFEPAAAHLVHMPAHIYMRTGDFAAAVAVNENASVDDTAYLKRVHEQDPEGLASHDHNLSMLAAAYADEGNWRGARRTALVLTADGMLVPALFVYLRLNRCADILLMPAPGASEMEPLRVPLWHYARGMAFACTRRLANAQAELALLRHAREKLHIPGTMGFFNSSDAVLGLADHLLAARIAALQGRRSAQIALLRSAVALQDNFIYVEPPDWYAPARESLGAALVAAGDYPAAGAVFREDLQRDPQNPRSLFGLSEVLEKMGDSAGASDARAQFNVAWKNADTSLTLKDM